MADYDFEAWAQSRVASNKPNPNQQAASSMQSVGIGGLGGRTTTAAAQRVQDQFSMFRDDDDRGSTYDYVPQTVTSGLGTPLTFPKTEKEDDRNIDQKIYDGMVSFGARFFGSQKESPSDYVLDVYETSPMFKIPTVPEVTERGIEKSFEQRLAEMFDSQGQNEYTPEIEGTGSYDEVPAPSTNENLMRNRINNILKDVIAPNSKEYEIQKGDTLSDISLREGVSVEDLAQVNEIENPNMILAGGTLIIPQVQEMEKAKEYVLRVTTRGDESLVDLTDPDAQFYQSGVPLDQRDFAPELGEDAQSVTGYDDVPQVVRGLMSKTNIVKEDFDTSDVESSRVSYESVKKVQKRLNDLGYTTLMGDLKVDGQLGAGTARQLRKFQAEAGLPVTAAAGQPVDEATQRALKNNTFYNKEGKDSKATVTPLQDGLFEIIKAPIAYLESRGNANPYAISGGHNDAYDGKYQLGKDAKNTIKNMRDEDGERIFTAAEREKLKHPSNRADFRADSELQEKAFRQLTEFNHAELTRNSAKYRAMDQANQLAVLGYAHNQGAEAALEWLSTQVVGTDAFGTGGDAYSEAITNEFMKDDMLG